jgi:hypothetical protein
MPHHCPECGGHTIAPAIWSSVEFWQCAQGHTYSAEEVAA